ncbi:LuxR C-terminal-related transcriptional regulator [Aureisphaera galaxeae]|uniref:tetratricopeptide repeat protein n=1 Tax=Aureisphaera galaxeae TaxID=1538023 RepID=UPI00234FBC69|nr:LuxR C-terminal-related transcriptional regulator [Aureisphaera galaxeae]MDC8005435.1 LuxR C-terminal-related transcriptional regulator [Aureisphaera galaxeae]
MRKSIFSLLCCLSVFLGVSQEQDSLEIAQNKRNLQVQLNNNEVSDNDKVDVLHDLGELYYGEENDSAYYYLKSALSLSKLRNDSLRIADSYVKLSLVGIYIDDYDTALAYIDSTFIYAHKTDPRYFGSVGWAYSIEGIVYNNYEKMDLALENILLANSFLEKAEKDEETQEYLIENYNDLSIVYFNIGSYETASKYAHTALEKAKEADSDYYEAQNHDMLGLIYNAQKEYELAEKHLDSANMHYESVGNDEGKMSTASNRGFLYRSRGMYQRAKEEYKKSLELSKKVEDVFSRVTAYTDLVDVHNSTLELEKSKAYLDSAKMYISEWVIPNYETNLALLESKILEKENNISGGIDILMEALKGEELKTFKQSELDVYEELARLFKKRGDYENGLRYFEKFNALKDTLQQKIQNDRLNVLRVEQNYNQVVAELENTETRLQLANIEKRGFKTRQYFIIGIAIMLILFAVFLFFRERKLNTTRRAALKSKQEVLKLKKAALDTEMRFKNKQITEFAIHISEKNELLEKIKSKLRGIKVTNETYREMVNDALHFINSDIEQNKEKVQLYQHIDETTDSFGAKIEQLYPNLSSKEKKVAIMLRLGQTSKQIGVQLNISPASVDNYRYNLRKKMEIPKGQSLKGFIQNL